MRSGRAVHDDTHHHPGSNVQRVALGDLCFQTERIHLHQRDDRRTGREIFTAVCVPLANSSTDWRIENGVGQLLAGDLQLRASLRQDALPVLRFVDRVSVVGFRDFERAA
jgi:hypothetical protein